MGWGHRTTLKVQGRLTVATAYLGGATAYLVGGATAYLGGCHCLSGQSVIIVPLRGSILQAETCQILSLAEHPRWSPSVAIVTRMGRIVTKIVKILIRMARKVTRVGKLVTRIDRIVTKIVK